jgi:hypothetical protein
MKRLIVVLAIFMAMAMFLPIMADAQNTASMQTWDKILTCTDGDSTMCNSSRFSCVLENQAVLDNETGLVWERKVMTTTVNYADAIEYCRELSIRDRKGWRMPNLDEFMSLIDMSPWKGPGPAIMLPRQADTVSPCYPFVGQGGPFAPNPAAVSVPASAYWTATPREGQFEAASYVVLVTGEGRLYAKKKNLTSTNNVWAVRGGGQGYRQY